jgi:hypothetical protein
MKKTLLLLAALAVGCSGQPSTKSNYYTHSQLNDLISAGQYPEQYLAEKTVDMEVPSMLMCLQGMQKFLTDERVSGYPVDTIADKKSLHVVKVWLNQGSVTVTCTPHRMIQTKAEYRPK